MPSYLYDHQKDLIQRVLEDKEGKWFVVKSFRQLSGKTFALENLVLAVALTRPGSVSIFVEPSNNQCSKVGSETYSAVAHIPGARFNGTSNILSFGNSSKIYFRSSEADTKTIRGYTVRKGGVLIVDEAQYVSEEYYGALFPVVQKYRASVVLASTPDRQTGTFYDFYERGLGNDLKIVSINWSKYLGNFYSQEELDFYKSVYSSRRFRTEILGEFSVSSGTVFSNLENCLGRSHTENAPCYVGIDWGSGSGKDYTAIVVLDENKDMVFLKYLNDISPMEQVKYIVKLLKDFKPRRCLVEGNSIGSIYFSALREQCREINIQKFQTTNDSKCRIVDQLVAHFEQQKIRIWDDEELLRELKGFEEQVTKSGLRTYNCPPPLHDDLVMALCIALEATVSRSGQYTIM